MPQYREGQTATLANGQKVIFQGGNWRDLDPGKLTEDQGKAATFGRLMSTAEAQYQAARQQGYNPGSLRNAAADVAAGLKVPMLGEPLAGLAPLIRDDASDRGVTAEKLWRDAQLKAMSGAAAPAQEMAATRETYFPHFGDMSADEQMMQSRRAAYEAAKMRAGTAGRTLPGYPQGGGRPPTPKVGQAYKGHIYLGGDPSKPSSWKKQ